MLPQLRSISQLYTVFPEANKRTEEAQQHKGFQAFDIFGAAAKEWLMPWKLTRISSFVDIVSFCSVSIILSNKAINHGSSPMCVFVWKFSTQILCMHRGNDRKYKTTVEPESATDAARSDSSGCMLLLL